MTNPEKIALKSKLKNFGLDLLRGRIVTAQEAMDQAQQAANSEEKSSAVVRALLSERRRLPFF